MQTAVALRIQAVADVGELRSTSIFWERGMGKRTIALNLKLNYIFFFILFNDFFVNFWYSGGFIHSLHIVHCSSLDNEIYDIVFRLVQTYVWKYPSFECSLLDPIEQQKRFAFGKIIFGNAIFPFLRSKSLLSIKFVGKSGKRFCGSTFVPLKRLIDFLRWIFNLCFCRRRFEWGKGGRREASFTTAWSLMRFPCHRCDKICTQNKMHVRPVRLCSHDFFHLI